MREMPPEVPTMLPYEFYELFASQGRMQVRGTPADLNKRPFLFCPLYSFLWCISRM
jgi:hypothetical protein